MMLRENATTSPDPTVRAASRKKATLRKSRSWSRASIEPGTGAKSSATHSETRPNDQARRGVWLGLALLLAPAAARGDGSLVAAVGGAHQVGGGVESERPTGASFEGGLALDVGTRLRVALTGLYAPDVGDPTRVDR